MPLKKFKANLKPSIKELSVSPKKNLLSSSMSGELLSTLKGRGMEFEDYRDYSLTDDAARIDWRASKRSQRVLVREYKLEINFSVFFLIDTSESMLFGSTKKLKCEYTAEVIASLFFGIMQTGNSIGFGLFSDTLHKYIPPMVGKRQYYTYSKEISNVKNYGGKKDLLKSLQHLTAVLKDKTLIFLVSDFITDNDHWITLLNVLSGRHEIIGVMIRDPRDITIPKDMGHLVIQDPDSKEKLYIDSKEYSHIYEEHNRREIKKVEGIFKHINSSLLQLTTDEEFRDQVYTFFKKSGARWK